MSPQPDPPPAPATAAPAGPGLIAGAYAVDTAHPLPQAGGGLQAFAVVDHRSGHQGLMAVQSERNAPPRANVLGAFGDWANNALLSPLALGPASSAHGEKAWFMISPAPPGPPLSAALRPWGERELLERVLRPVAGVLQALEERHITHRAIRLDNLFQVGPSASVVLGTAWSAPPAFHQPALYEPAYSAMCLRSGRGEGCVADDVYALGVVLVALALGKLPMEELAPEAMLRRKLELGSFAALVGNARLPPVINDLARGMLAEDPEHRPPPALLVDPVAARARRVAARPPRRAQHPLELSGSDVWDARTLACAIAQNPEGSPRLLRSGSVERWLRRNLGDSAAAAKLAEVVHLRTLDGPVDDARADGMLVMRAVASLDPLAPLCWRGVALWPDGLGPALADAMVAPEKGSVLAERLTEIVDCEASGHWAQMRPERSDPTLMQSEARHRRTLMRQRGWAGGLPRLAYALNPLLPCASPLLGGSAVVRTPELLQALNAAAANAQIRRSLPMDHDIAAFVAARADQSSVANIASLNGKVPPDQASLLQLRTLANLQQSGKGVALPGLAGWLLEQLGPAIAAWHNRQRREALERALGQLASAGNLAAMATLIDSPEARKADQNGHRAAIEAAHRIDDALRALAAGRTRRADSARQMGQELTLGVAVMALTAAVVAMVLS